MSGIKGRSGRKPDTKKDIKVIELKQKGLSFRDIAKILEEDVKCTYRRYKRVLTKNKKLSTK